jgi:hypothetical protein
MSGETNRALPGYDDTFWKSPLGGNKRSREENIEELGF